MRRGILASREQLIQLRERIARRPFDKIHDFLRSRCNLILQSAPLTEAQWRLSAQGGAQAAALLAARTTQGRIMDLAIAYHVDRNPAYRDRAIEELRSLVAWSAWLDPNHAGSPADLCTAEAAAGAVIALDWLWEEMTEPDRLRVLHAVRHKAIEPYVQAVRQGAWWYNCYHAWNAVVNSGCGLAALAMGDELPLAREAYRLARAGLKHFFDALGREGGWDEGTGYWGYAMRYVLLLGEAAHCLDDDSSIFHARGMDATGYFPIYFTPNGQPASLGDMPTVPLLGAMYLLVKHFGAKDITWWLDTYAFHRDVSTADYSAAALALLCRPVDAEVPLQPDLKPLKVFNEIGWAAMADAWPRPSLYVAAKAGDLSAHHGRQDMNTVQIQVRGEMLIPDWGYGLQRRGRWHDGIEEALDRASSQSHNTLTVGQRDHQVDAQGNIVEAQVGANFRWLACDAGSACGENVHFIRHVVMLVNPGNSQGQLILVLDEIANPAAERVDLYWHSLAKVELNASMASGSVTGAREKLYLALAASSALSAKLDKSEADAEECVIHATVAGAGKLLLASIFSPQPIGKVEIKKNSTEVRVKTDLAEIHFKLHRKYLHLDKVVEKRGL